MAFFILTSSCLKVKSKSLSTGYKIKGHVLHSVGSSLIYCFLKSVNWAWFWLW